MKLKALLLGSAAAIFVGGAATTASAADAAGLVVATMQSNAAYVPLCNGDDGFQLNGWCFVFTGEVEFTYRQGWQTTRTFGAVPNAGNDPPPPGAGGGGGTIDEPTTIVREIPTNAIFNLTQEFEIEVDNGYTEFTLAISGGTLTLDIGNFAFTTNGLTWSPSVGDIDFDIRLRESDTLGWRDQLRGDIGTANPATGNNVNVRNWIPVTNVPDGEIAVDFGNIDFAFNAGARRLRPNTGANTLPYVVTLAPGTANTVTTFGGEANFEFELGDAITITGGADFDRVVVPSALAFVGDAAPPGDDTVTYAYGWAYGGNIGVEVELGPITAEVHGYYGVNYGGYTMYQYWYQPAGAYWAVEGVLGVEIGNAEFTLEATLTDGPQIGMGTLLGAGPNVDRVLLVEAGIELAPAALDDVTINLGALLERQMYTGGFRRLVFTAGADFEPADDVELGILLTHTRPIATWGGSPFPNNVPASTKIEGTLTVGF